MISKGNLDKSWLHERKKELEAFVDFSNAEIQSMEDREIAALVYNCRFFETEWMPFIFASRDSALDPPGAR